MKAWKSEQDDLYTAETVVFGCGNTLFGDDGFGPAVIGELQDRNDLPPGVVLVDAGTGIREYLFDYLLDAGSAPNRLIFLDGTDQAGRRPGEVFVMDPDQISAPKAHDFSLHQAPTLNLLGEIVAHTDIRVNLVVARMDQIPDHVAPGLSPVMEMAVREAGKLVWQMIAEDDGVENRGR